MTRPFDAILGEARLARHAELAAQAKKKRVAGMESSATFSRASELLAALTNGIDMLRRRSDASFRFLAEIDRENEGEYYLNHRLSGTNLGHIVRASRLDLPPRERFVGFPEEVSKELQKPKRFRMEHAMTEKERKLYLDQDSQHPWGWHLHITNPFLGTASLLRIPRDGSRDPSVVAADPKPSMDTTVPLPEFAAGPTKISARPDKTIEHAAGILAAHLAELDMPA